MQLKLDNWNASFLLPHTYIPWWLKWYRICLQCRRPWRRQWHPTPVLLPGKSHGWRSLVGCGSWGRLDMTGQLHFHFSLSGIGERNGNPLQCSCLENPRDGGAWWAAIYGVAESRTRLKQLSSSSSSSSSSNGRPRFNPWVWKIPWRWEWLPTPVFLGGESHGQRSLVGYSPRGTVTHE